MRDDGISVELEGLAELQKKLRGLSDELEKKGGKWALGRATNFIRDEAIKNARAIDDPITPTVIADNIVAKSSASYQRRTGDLLQMVGILGGAKKPESESTSAPGGLTYHWRFVEFGTEQQSAQPFMRPALADNWRKAVDIFMIEFRKKIDRLLAAKK